MTRERTQIQKRIYLPDVIRNHYKSSHLQLCAIKSNNTELVKEVHYEYIVK